MIRSLELFSGAGGLAKGSELAGACHGGLIEWNRDACLTLMENFGKERVFQGDAKLVDKSIFSNIDFIAGGPPCQPFSLGGKALGMSDKRDMFPVAIEYIRHFLPKAFVLENVKGLLRQSFRDYLNYIILQLRNPCVENTFADWQTHYKHLLNCTQIESQAYDVSVKLLNAADFGVPQKRERIIIVGYRKDLGITPTFPFPTHSQNALLWSKWVTGQYWESHNIVPTNKDFANKEEVCQMLKAKSKGEAPSELPWLTIRDALDNIPTKGSANFFENEHIIRDGAREYPGHTGSCIDEPSKTIKAGNHGVPGGENMIKNTDGSVRYLTVFEAKRIQTFPDDFHICGSWTEAMRQIGNAVPVRLAEVVTSNVLSKL